MFLFLFVVCMRNVAKTDKWYKYGDHKLKTTSGRRVLWIGAHWTACGLCASEFSWKIANTNRHHFLCALFFSCACVCACVCYLFYLVVQIEHNFCNCCLYFCMFSLEEKNKFSTVDSKLNQWNQRRNIYETICNVFMKYTHTPATTRLNKLTNKRKKKTFEREQRRNYHSHHKKSDKIRR